MSTCKDDCLHYEACRMNIHHKTNYERFEEKYKKKIDSSNCSLFKDRSKFIELPCKVGQMVYRICPVPKGKGCGSCPWEYCYCYDIGYQKDRPNTIREVKARDFEWVIKRKPYFGRTYFSTREEAEQALKEQSDD